MVAWRKIGKSRRLHCRTRSRFRSRFGGRNGLWRSLVSALVWGTKGRGFESRQPDRDSGSACRVPRGWSARGGDGKSLPEMSTGIRCCLGCVVGTYLGRGARSDVSANRLLWTLEVGCHDRDRSVGGGCEVRIPAR